MDDHDDPFQGLVDDGEDDSAVGELGFDLNQLRKATPGLASENLDADGLVDFDREVATSEHLEHCLLTKLLTNTFHNLLKPLKMAALTRMRFPTNPLPPLRNKVGKAIKILNRLALFTADLDLDP